MGKASRSGVARVGGWDSVQSLVTQPPRRDGNRTGGGHVSLGFLRGHFGPGLFLSPTTSLGHLPDKPGPKMANYSKCTKDSALAGPPPQ